MAGADQLGGVLIILQETTERVLTEQRLRFLVDLSTRLRGVADAREVMATAAEMLGRHLKANRAGYYEPSEDRESFAVEREWPDATTLSFAGEHRIRDFGTLIDRELKAGRTVCIDDALVHPLTAEEPVAAEFLRAGKRSTIIAPLIRCQRRPSGSLLARMIVNSVAGRRHGNCQSDGADQARDHNQRHRQRHYGQHRTCKDNPDRVGGAKQGEHFRSSLRRGERVEGERVISA
jgi:GAF domain-containing protein